MPIENTIVFPSNEFNESGIRLTPHKKLAGVFELAGYAFAFSSEAAALEPANLNGKQVVNEQGLLLVRVSPFDGHVFITKLDSDRLSLLGG